MSVSADLAWGSLAPRRSTAEAIVRDLLESRVRFVENGRCGLCDAPLAHGAWCWTGLNATGPYELHHLAEPAIGVLFPSELAIVEPWLEQQRATSGVRDFRAASLAASAAPVQSAPTPRPRRIGVFLLGFVLGAIAGAGALVAYMSTLPMS